MNATEREQWLKERRKGIGSSDAAAVCGESPWSNPLAVYYDKTGELPDAEPTPAMRRGVILEPAIAAMYEQETGNAVEEYPLAMHPDYPWMIASIDRRLADAPKVVECKKASFFVREQWGEAGSADIPSHYRIQVQHQLAVLGWDLADVAALIGDDFRVYHLERDDKIIESLISIEGEFWEKVMKREPPEPDWRHASTPELLKAIYGVAGGKEVDLAEEEAAFVAAYQEAGEREKQAKAAKDEAKAHLLHAMGDAALGRLSDGTILTRKEIQRKAYSVEATSFIDFRVRNAKISKA